MLELERRRWWALGAIALCILVIGLDATILNVALPTLAGDIQATNSQLQWIVDAYILVLAGLLLPAGALGDRYGRKRMVLIGLALFGVASVAATLTSDAGQLIAARAVMGIGAAILMPVTTALIPVLFGDAERTRAVAITTASIGVGVPLGPLVGGFLLNHFWWGSVFLVNVPVVALAMVAVALLIPESRDPRSRPIDLPGGALSTIGLVALVYGIVESPNKGWGDSGVLGSIAIGVVALASFVLWQRRARNPMIDLGLFRRSRFLWGSVAATIGNSAMFGLFFVLPQYLQVVRGNDALGTGVRLLPMMAGLIVAARASERAVQAFGTRIPAAAGLLITAAGLVWGATTDAGTSFGVVAAWLVLIGFGIGASMTPAMDAILGALPKDRAGAGSALTMALRQVGAALGIAILGTILANVYTGNLPAGVPGPVRDSVAGAARAATELGDPTLLAAGQSAYLDAMSVVLLVCAAGAVAGAALMALFMPARAPVPAAEGQSEYDVVRTA